MRKKKNKKTVTDTGYKKVDRKEKKKKEKQEEKRRQKKLSVQQSIAYKEMGRDGICRVQGKTYSKCIRFYDINYQLAQNEDKNAIFENWCDFLNYFDASIHFQLSFINHKSSMKEFEQVIRIRPQEDAFDDVRMEYAKMLKQQLAKGNNGLVKSKYITFSIEADNIREAKPKLERIESDILNNFKILGVPAYPLNGVERLQILYETFNPDIMTDFQFDYGSMIRTGLNTKDYVAPTSFVFKDRNTFRMGNTIGAVSYLQILAPELTDKMLAEFLDIDKNLIVNLHVQSVDQMKAIKLVKSKVTDINRMKIEEQKKAVRAGYDMDIIPSDLNTYGGEAFAYKMKMDAMRRTAGRPTKENPRQNVGNYETADLIGKDNGESGRQVQRYIRLTELIPELLDLVDKKKLQFTVAIDISYIDKEVQEWIYEYISDTGFIKPKQIAALRNQLNDGPINQIQMLSIFNNCVMAKKVSRSLTFSEKKLTKYFPDDYTAKDMEQVIESLLEKWMQEQSC